MAIIDIFKKKKQEKIDSTKKIESQKPKEAVLESKVAAPKEKKADSSWMVLKTPHITEKATVLAKQNQYVFKIWPDSTKNKVKKAVENLYGVEVLDVKIVKVPRKRRQLGRIFGWRKGYKKAIVRIKEGQKIEVLPR